MDNDETQRALARAKYYFEHDYKDRGMVKWNGYYLSDHTENAIKAAALEAHKRNQVAMPEMSLEDISKILFEAYAKHLQVQIQERTRESDGSVPSVVTGFVGGFVDQDIYIANKIFNLDNILWCQICYE